MGQSREGPLRHLGRFVQVIILTFGILDISLTRKRLRIRLIVLIRRHLSLSQVVKFRQVIFVRILVAEQ